MLQLGFFSNSSATTFVVARFIPELAKVIPNKYIEEIKLKIPIVSAPILLAIYISKIEVMILITRELQIIIKLFI